MCFFFAGACVSVCVFLVFLLSMFFFKTLVVVFYFLPVFCFSTASDFFCSLLRPEILSFLLVFRFFFSSASDFFFLSFCR